MRDSKRIRLICLVLCIAMSLSFFAGCRSKKDTPADESQTQTSAPDETGSDTDDSSEPESTDSADLTEDWEEDPQEDPQEDPGIVEMNAQIKNTTPLSTRYMGSGSGIYFCYTFMPDDRDRVATDEMAKVEMDRLQNMGIHLVRTMYQFRWARDESTATGWDWDSVNMKAVYKWLNEMKKRNIDVMMNPWYFNWLSKENGTAIETTYFQTGDFNENSRRWCAAVADLYRELWARGYTNAKYLVMFTEPIYSSVDGNAGEYDQYIYNLKNVHQVLSKAGLRSGVQIMGPNRSDANLTLLLRCQAEADEAIDIYSQHQYTRANDLTADTYYDDVLNKWGIFYDTLKNTGNKKPYWVDEWNVQDNSQTKLGYSNVGFDEPLRGLQQAVSIVTGMNCGVDNMMLWALADQQWPSNHNNDLAGGFYDGVSFHGMFYNIQDTMVPKAQYYSYSLLSKYTGRGGGITYLSEPEDVYAGVYMGTVKTADGNWTVIVCNSSMDDVRLKVDIEKSLGGVKLYRHQYVANEVKPDINATIIPANKTIRNVTNGFTDIIRAFSVAVYTTIKG